MPEGDTIFRAARALKRALAGHVVTRFESAFPALTRVAVDRPIVGRSIESVSSRGKHLLMTLTGDLILHTHMRMNGSWHLYRPGEGWQRSRDDMRVLIATGAFVAVGFNVPVAEWLSARDPFAPVSSLDDAGVGRLIDVARELLTANVLEPAQSLSAGFGRRTTRSMNPAARLWVYSRGGKPCRRCGAVIQATQTGVDARITYWCPRCQAV